jgi:hypothetical protein
MGVTRKSDDVAARMAPLAGSTGPDQLRCSPTMVLVLKHELKAASRQSYSEPRPGLEVLGPPPQSVCREKAVQGFQSAPF